MLTTGVDTVPGSTGTELITGGSTALSSTDTLQASDQIDGGAGRDTANLSVTKNFAGFTVGTGFMKNVETVNLTNSSVSTTTFTAKAVSGVETYNVTGPVSVTGIDSIATKVNFSTIPTANTARVGFADELVTSAADATTVTVSGLGTASTSSSTPLAGTRVTLDVPGIETLTLNAAGRNDLILSGAALKAVVATGSGSITLTDVPSAVKSYDGSPGTGNQIVGFTGASNMTSVKTGSGDDQVWVTVAGQLRADAAIDAGAGADRLVIATGAAVTGAYSMTGVETLVLGVANTAATLAFSSAKDLATISVLSTVNAANSITGLGAIPITVSLGAPVSGDGNSTLTVENAAAATLTATLDSGAASGVTTDAVTFTKATSLNVNVPSSITIGTAGQGVITATAAKEVTVSGSGTFTGASTSTGLTIPAATKLTIDQTSSSRIWSFGVDKTAAVTNAPLTDVIINAKGTLNLLGSNAPFNNIERLDITTGRAFAGNTTFVNAGGDSALTKLATATLGGAETDASVTLGALGGNNAYGLTMTATGLKAGLTATTLTAGLGQTISLDLKGVTGAVTLGAVSTTGVASAATGGTGSYLLNASGSTSEGDFTQNATINARTVSIDLSGSSFGSTAATGAVTFGAITGTTISLKSPTAPTAFSVGKLTASSSVVLEGPSTVSANLPANPVLIDASSTSTALAVSLSGGLAVDTFTVLGAATQTSITVTGDLKGGADVVTINGAASTVAAGQLIDVSGLADSTTSIVGSSNAAATTIKGSAGVDTIEAGVGADTIDISTGGNDVIFYRNMPLETAAVSSVTRAGVSTTLNFDHTVETALAKILVGDVFSTTALDKITGFSSGDKIVTNTQAGTPDVAATTLLQTPGEFIGVGRTLTGAAKTAIATDRDDFIDLFIQGTYSASGTFTVSSSGTDTLYLVEATGQAAAAAFHGVVLVGYVAGGTADTSNTAGLTGLVGAALV